MRVLVTGTAGFIFGNFLRRVCHSKTKQDYELVSVDRVRKGSVVQDVYRHSNHAFYIANVTDAHTMNVIFETSFQNGPPEVVIHGAAETNVDNSIADNNPFVLSNVLGTQVIIDCCLRWGVKKLVYISTDEVYGHLTSENDPAWTEDSPTNPRNPYSATKLAGELLVKAAHETHGLTYNITRSCNNYGLWQDPSKFIPKIIKSIQNGVPMPVYGKGAQVRDWIHVHDCCDAIAKIVNEGKDNETYNISAGQEFSNLEVFHEICNVFDKGYELLHFVDDRPGHDFRYSVDSSKLRGLGWKPTVRFKDGIVGTCDWYESNRYVLR